MATSFIKIEPSCDIHLVLDPAFGQPQVTLRIFAATTGTLADGTDVFQYRDIAADVAIDDSPVNQAIVGIQGAVLTPLAKGTAFIQIRYTDPDPGTDEDGKYHYLLARIMVHERFDTWWFGNESISVFNDPDMAHAQPSLYASFDNGEVVGDITGHGYVQLTSTRPDLFVVANDPARPYTGRIRGVAAGDGSLTGVLMGKTLNLQVRSVEFGAAGNNRVLERLWGNWNVPPRQRTNMLLIYEGFTDRNVYAQMNNTVIERFFHSERHSPYNLLKDDINVWGVFPLSQEAMITTGFQVTETGRAFPRFNRYDTDETPKGHYKLRRLTELVGFSTQGLAERGLTTDTTTDAFKAAAKTVTDGWAADATITGLGYDPDSKPNAGIVGEWMDQVPLNVLPQAVNSFYGFAAGNRPGEVESRLTDIEDDDGNNQEDLVSRGNPAFDATTFTLRIRQWYVPSRSNAQFRPSLDYRRWAPDVYRFGEDLWMDFIIRRHIAQFDEALTPIDPTYRVGQCWDSTTAADVNSPDLRSIGLVCFMINHPLAGRAHTSGDHFVTLSTGPYGDFFGNDSQKPNNTAFNLSTGPDQTSTLTISPTIAYDYEYIVATLAHELGHSFVLGDEYEEDRTDDQEALNRAHSHDNLMHYDDLKLLDNPPPQSPPPVDPDNTTWSVLHRVKYSFRITATATVGAGNSVTVAFSAADLKGLKEVQQQSLKLYIRRLIVNMDGNDDRRQLRPSLHDMVTQDLFTELDISGTIDETNLQVTLNIPATGNPSPLANVLIPAGSILYVPQRDVSTNAPLTVIETPVMDFMTNTPYDGSDTPGRALSSNYDTSTQDWKPVNKGKDSPISIPNWKGPCKDYTMIGLYEGGAQYVKNVYRPAGACKMRDEHNTKDNKQSQFCFVCKYLIVSRVNPSKLAALDKEYPASKGNKWQNLVDALGNLNLSGIH